MSLSILSDTFSESFGPTKTNAPSCLSSVTCQPNWGVMPDSLHSDLLMLFHAKNSHCDPVMENARKLSEGALRDLDNAAKKILDTSNMISEASTRAPTSVPGTPAQKPISSRLSRSRLESAKMPLKQICRSEHIFVQLRLHQRDQ